MGEWVVNMDYPDPTGSFVDHADTFLLFYHLFTTHVRQAGI
jgi:hypothetical protein